MPTNPTFIGLLRAFGRFLLALAWNVLATMLWKRFLCEKPLAYRHRHLISFLLGSLTIFIAYGIRGILMVAIPSLSIYFLQSWLTAHPKRSLIGWILMFGWLFYSHAKSAYKKGSIDYNGSLMVLVANICMLLFDLGKGSSSPNSTRHHQHLSLAHILGYVFFWPCILAGPCLKLNQYEEFIGSKACSGNTNESKKRITHSLLALVIHVAGGFLCNLYNLEGQFFDNLSLPYKFLFVWGVAVVARCKYYFVWCLAEGLLWNLHFPQKNVSISLSPKPFEQVRISKVEWASSPRDLISNWNISISSNWLYECVYLPSGKSALLTNFVSASWHGFHLGYYISFLSIGLATVVWRKAYRLGITFGPMAPIITQFVMNGLLMPFVLLGARESFHYILQVRALPHFFVLGLWVWCTALEAFKKPVKAVVAASSSKDK